MKESDWFENISSKFDLIVSNPPYIAENELVELEKDVTNFDPLIAISPGKDRLSAYQKIVGDAFDRLEVGGRLVLEIGSTQGKDLTQILDFHGFKQIAIHKDLDNYDRVVSGIR